MIRTRRQSARRPTLESLEDRRLLSPFTVENTNPSGTGSLAAAIASADVDHQANTIAFDPTVFGTPQTITLERNVPALELTDTGGLQTITGPSAGVTIRGGGTSGVFQVENGVTATLSGLTITGGNSGKGGGVYNVGTVALTECTLSGNSANSGGGVDNYTGTATFTDCTISGNSGGFSGGGVYSKLGTVTLTDCTISGNNAAQEDGGLANGGMATLTGCTISGNSAKYGGGVYNFNYGTATLTDCTISGNSAEIRGGGLSNQGKATLTDCTLSGNSAVAGGGVYSGSHRVTLTGTIVAGNSGQSAPDDIVSFPANAVTGSYNLIGTGGSSGIVNGSQGNIVLTSLTSLGLAPLGDYGGPTETMALLLGSPALGAGIATDYPGTTTPITTDQRGFLVDSPNPDIGAFQGVNLEVESTSGSVDTQPSSLTLPGAISLANTHERTTITFDPAVFATPQTITLTGSPLELSNAGSTTSIMGPAAGVTVSGGGQSGVFEVEKSVTAALSGLTITDGNSRFGGGVDNYSGTVTLTDCTISGNSAQFGGGVDNNAGTVTLTDCTLSGNSANYGGGVDNYIGTATLTDCTVSGNSATRGGGGVYNGPGTTTLIGTIVAGNSDQSGSDDIVSFPANAITGSYNLIGTGGSGGIVNGSEGNIVLTSLTNLGLAALGDYGGPTETMALLLGSPALGAGTAADYPGTTTPITTDQRGFPVDSPNPDIGAFQGVIGAVQTAPTTTAVKPDTATVTYGQSATFTANVSSANGSPTDGSVQFFVNGAAYGSAVALSAGSAQLAITEPAGSYTIAAQYTGAADFSATLPAAETTAALTVSPAPLTITANDKTKVYGAALPTLTASCSGFVNGDTAASLTTRPTLTTTATASSDVSGSPYTITAAGAVDSNYTISYVAGSLTVTPAPLTITANNKTKVYGAALPSLTASYKGFVNGDTSASLTTQPTLTTTATASSDVSGSPYAITAAGAVDSDYTISYVAGSLTVTPVALTITANNQTKVYGAPLPALTASYSGFVNGDNSANLTTQPKLTTTATAGSHVSGSPYAITASGAVDKDYTISYVAGALTVTPAPLTITANNLTKIYGAALPSLTASYTGFVNGNSSASLTTRPTLTTTATASSHVAGSPYAITAAGAVDSDYTISYVAGALTVTPAALTITANSQSKAYGAALPSLTAKYTGFVNGDTAASLTTQPKLTTMATASSHVSGSPYAITASGAVDKDYTISYVAGALTVTPVALTITANNQTKVYGAALPSLTAEYTGFVNGDTAASLTTQPKLTTTATASSHVSGSPYTITASGAVDSDYTISYVAGSLTVTPAALTITANSQSKAYGAALPSLTAKYTGFVNGDTAASLTTQPKLTTTATASSHVSGSPYAITAAGAVDKDYTISYVAGAFTVTPVALTITANNQTKVYGTPLPALTASYSGFVNGDTSASLTTQPKLTTTATAGSHVSGSPYAITAAGAVDSDYTIRYVAGSLTVTPVALTIMANNKTKVYGAALPSLTASYKGFVNGDTAAGLTTLPTLTTTATAASHVSGSPYTITASGAVDSNYTISYVAGSLTVTPAPLTITADNKTKVYGAALPSLTASYKGFVNGDTSASLTTQPTLTTTATASSDVSGSPYAITAAGAVDSDYTISYVAGSLTVTPASLKITPTPQTKPYGEILSFGSGSTQFTSTGLQNGETIGSVTLAVSNNGGAVTAAVGSYTIAASAATGGTFTASNYSITYATAKLTVSKAATTTAVTPSTATVSLGQSATFTANVSSADGSPPDGFVQFLVDGVAYGSVVALVDGTAQIAITKPAGSYTIAAKYTGDTNFAATLSAGEITAKLTVKPL